MSAEGQGIGRIEGLAVFVAGAVTGDVIRVELTSRKKNYALGKLIEISEPSACRVSPPCAHHEDCGGCSLQCMSYGSQLQWKRKLVEDKLIRIGGVEAPLVRDTIGMDTPWRYRNKAQFSVEEAGGAAAVGFYRAKSHKVVNLNECRLQSGPAEALALTLRAYLAANRVSAGGGKGLIRRLIVRTAFGTGEVMAILVLNGRGLPDGEELVHAMDDAVGGLAPDPDTGVEFSLESVILNLNKKGAPGAGGEYAVFAGKPVISERAGGLNLEISPESFYQVNPVQMVKLYDKALEYAGLTGRETLLDLYCGVGSIGLYCASRAKTVIGIESVKSAVLDANRNAALNGAVNAAFLCGRAEAELPGLLKQGIRPDVIILDPPRSGCAPALLDAAAAAAPSRLVYISCDPATQARDIKILGAKGYRLVEAQPVDMFPHTTHVETVALLCR
jgi:23S rRNA (uracil1939-C5)-methyltransferase